MENNVPLVSVAIITYNQKEFLIEAIESVLEQDYPNIEIVVADDHSTDGTAEILREYADKNHGKFVLRIADKNMGITKNSNAAHFACSGKYIAWLGGDDLMHKDKISKQVMYLESHPDCNIVYHNLEVFESETKKLIGYYNTKKDCYEGDIRVLIKHGTFNSACSNMIRFDKTPPAGFNEELDVASDWLYFIECLKQGGTINFINEILGKYRRHANNVSNKDSPFYKQGMKDHFCSLEILKSFEVDYKKEINYRLSTLYKDLRQEGYLKNLRKSLGYNPVNMKSWILLLLYMCSFKKIKL